MSAKKNYARKQKGSVLERGRETQRVLYHESAFGGGVATEEGLKSLREGPKDREGKETGGQNVQTGADRPTLGTL